MVPSADSPEEHDVPTEPSHGRGFSVDDAFAEGGEDDDFQFTTDAIRDELARSVKASVESHGDSDEDELSVSMDDLKLEDSVPSASSHEELGGEGHSPNFEHEISSKAQDSTDSVGALPRPSSNTSSHNAFPSVVIDLSKGSETQIIEVKEPATGVNIPVPTTSNQTLEHRDNGSSSSHIPHYNQGSDSAISTSQSVPVVPIPPRIQTHRQTKSSGPSTLEKVLSKTRPTFLPPKAKDEDKRHLADWEAMMRHSRAAEERKKKMREERRLARELAVEDSIPIWEQNILPNWKTAVRDPNHRKMWRQGVPPKLRGSVWEKAIGNGLALSKESYRACLARAQRAMLSRTFPATVLNLIDEDIRSTFPTLHIFTPTTGPLFQDLFDILCAWVVARSDEGLGYVTGASKIAAMLLLNMQPSTAFVAMRNLLEQRHCLRSFYGYGGISSREDIEAYYRIFDTLLADYMPKIYFNFKQHQVSPSAYLPEWIVPLFLDHLSLEACARLWDIILLEGDSFLFRTALAVLAVLEPRLFFPDRKELLDLLSGNNKAAIEVAKREGNSSGTVKYEIFNVNEETVWEEIEAMETWWRDSTWLRLIQRELPDL